MDNLTLPPITDEQLQTLNSAAGIARNRGDYSLYELLRAKAEGEKKYADEAALKAELEKLGGKTAAEAGWNALRAHNPNVDQSTGVTQGDVKVFDDLPIRVQINYARFAQGVMDNLEVQTQVPYGQNVVHVLMRQKNADIAALVATIPAEVFGR